MFSMILRFQIVKIYCVVDVIELAIERVFWLHNLASSWWPLPYLAGYNSLLVSKPCRPKYLPTSAQTLVFVGQIDIPATGRWESELLGTLCWSWEWKQLAQCNGPMCPSLLVETSKTSKHFGHYTFPDPGLFVSPGADEKKAKFVESWLHIRESWMMRLASETSLAMSAQS